MLSPITSYKDINFGKTYSSELAAVGLSKILISVTVENDNKLSISLQYVAVNVKPNNY